MLPIFVHKRISSIVDTCSVTVFLDPEVRSLKTGCEYVFDDCSVLLYEFLTLFGVIVALGVEAFLNENGIIPEEHLTVNLGFEAPICTLVARIEGVEYHRFSVIRIRKSTTHIAAAVVGTAVINDGMARTP